jgi:lysophospholipase L1-like esterase
VAVAYSTIVWWLVGVAVVSAAAGFLFEWMAASAGKSTPAKRLRSGQRAFDQFEPTAVLLGVFVGLVVAAVALATSAIVDTAAQQTAPTVVALPQTAPYTAFGNYVALGDSYSAGQGLDPTGDCSQSTQAYGHLLAAAEKWQHVDFEACSGAVIGDIFGKAFFGPQVKAPSPEPDIGLVTMTIGGNDALFSNVVTTCIKHPSCMWGDFPPANVTEQEQVNGGKPEPLEHQWAQQTMVQIEGRLDTMFSKLTTHFPNARLVVVGYPYLFPDGPAPLAPDLMCATMLRRVDEPDRAEIRYLQDEFNDVIYEEALRYGVDFVSPQALWAGHEPCGQHGQWTNALELFLSTNPLGKGSFHPTSAGQHALAALVSCYLSTHPDHPSKQQLAIPSGAPVPHNDLTESDGTALPAAWGTSRSDFGGCGFK